MSPSSLGSVGPPTFLVAVEEDALGLQDEDDVLRVGPVYDAGRLGAQELIGLVHFLKHILHTKKRKHTDRSMSLIVCALCLCGVWFAVRCERV